MGEKKESRATTPTIFKVVFKPSSFARGLRWNPVQNAHVLACTLRF
jgi:hypothetical protein